MRFSGLLPNLLSFGAALLELQNWGRFWCYDVEVSSPDTVKYHKERNVCHKWII